MIFVHDFDLSQWVFLPTVGVANPLWFVGVFVGLLPLFWFCCFVWFAFFLTKRKSGRGICGSSAVVSGVFCFDVDLLLCT